MKKIIFLTALIFFCNLIFGQIRGRVEDTAGQALAGVLVKVLNQKVATFTDSDGYFELQVKSPQAKVRFSFMGYQTLDTVLPANGKMVIIRLRTWAVNLEPVHAYARKDQEPSAVIFKGELLEALPSVSGNLVETLIMTSMGVQAVNELSSQYSVRGGNFDENLTYIEGIKVFRPILLRSAQQEGLSIINSDLVSNIKFSAGGFSPVYGDKMSSVLDITYRRPRQSRANVEMSLLGAGANLDYVSETGRFSAIAGLRLKQNSYLLNALPVKGNYRPFFSDFQSLLRINLSSRAQLGLFAYLAYNQYNFIPDSMTVALGTFTTNFRLPVYYEGKESDLYQAGLFAAQLWLKLTQALRLRLISSLYQANEQEKYTFEAFYRLDMVDRRMTNKTNDSVINIGVGAFAQYGRNFLNALIWRNVLRLEYNLKYQSFILGFEQQSDYINDWLNRWYYVDSAGYNFNPFVRSPHVINLYQHQNAQNSYADLRLDAYFLHYLKFFIPAADLNLTWGVRYIYWNYAKEQQLDPRLTLTITPNWLKIWKFRLSVGKYTQVPFYNDLRNLDGSLVPPTLAHTQKALHFVVGAYRNFTLWNRPFQFTTEWYYKYLYDIIPFEYDNMRIQYYADQVAKGFAYGADFRLYGEFVPETDSWISLSLLHTAEDIEGDQYWQYLDAQGNPTSYKPLAVDSVLVEPGYIPRPTDQWVTVGMFFQDYMPQNRNMRVSLGLFYGSGRPFGPPGKGRRYATLRMPMYLRADLGFSYVWKPRFAKAVFFEVDLLNAFNANNVASYSWLLILTNPALIGSPLANAYMVQLAVPNYLTGRLFNFKVKIKF